MSRNEFIQLTAALTYAIGQREPNMRGIAALAGIVHKVAPLEDVDDLATCADALRTRAAILAAFVLAGCAAGENEDLLNVGRGT